MVKDVTAVPEVNKVYMGKVAKIVEFGAFVQSCRIKMASYMFLKLLTRE